MKNTEKLIKSDIFTNRKHKSKKHSKVLVERLNWDAIYYNDIYTGIGFTITEPADVTLDGNKKKSLNGPQSPRYGTTYEDEQSFIERYRCECGAFMGKQFEHEICPICNTPVEFKDSNINTTGWISLGENKIINPLYYNLLSSAIGTAPFTDIISAKYKITKDGHKLKPREDELDEKPTSPYAGIGIDNFYDRYEEIIDYFIGKKKNKVDTLTILKKEKPKVFTSHIPIISTILRPQSVTNDTFYFNSIDKVINTLCRLAENIKDCEPVEKDNLQARIQTKVNLMWDTYFQEINGKEGLIRGTLLGGSLNYTSRNVIVPSPDLADDEVDLSYFMFLEVFKYTIIYYVMRLEDTTLSKAYGFWKESSTFNQKMYDIMSLIVKKEHVSILINRNPTLNFYSMLLMKVRSIKCSGDDYSLSVPLSILPGLNADFDGDIMNIIGMMDKSITYMFRKFSPVERMIISRDTGMLNDYFSINKDQLIVLLYFSIIGKMENDQEEVYPVKDDKTGEVLWVKQEDVDKYASGIYKDAYIADNLQ